MCCCSQSPIYQAQYKRAVYDQSLYGTLPQLRITQEMLREPAVKRNNPAAITAKQISLHTKHFMQKIPNKPN
jgi:hypothetical protein